MVYGLDCFAGRRRSVKVGFSIFWRYSSYREFAGFCENYIYNKQLVIDLFGSEENFILFSNNILNENDMKYWV